MLKEYNYQPIIRRYLDLWPRSVNVITHISVMLMTKIMKMYLGYSVG